MADQFKFRKEGGYTVECGNCGSEAPLAPFNMGPPNREDALLCEYCANVTSKESDECRHLAQMFNTLERRLKAHRGRDGT